MQKKKVLFLCIGNSCRSQMAEGITNHYFGDKIKAYSAGNNPRKEVNRMAIKVMKEIGIDISKQYPKPVETFKNMKFDYVISVCGGTPGEIQCPFFPGKTQLHWPFPDPAFFSGTPEEKLNEFRRIRDEIERKILELFANPKILKTIENYNELFAPEAMVSFAGEKEGEYIIRFSGPFCETCGLTDYFDDFVIQAKKENINLMLTNFIRIGGQSYLVKFKPRFDDSTVSELPN